VAFLVITSPLPRIITLDQRATDMKVFNEQSNIGKAKYIVNFHDGAAQHKDGSPFFDMRIFTNKVKKNTFITSLKKQGYTMGHYHDLVKREARRDIIKKINQRIASDVPVAVVNMPYARTWVFETIANRLSMSSVLISVEQEGFTKTLPFNKLCIDKGIFAHLPELEAYAYDILEHYLPEINTRFPTLDSRQALSSFMADCV
jgi:hypothetical protein